MKYKKEIHKSICDIITKYNDLSNKRIMIKLAKISDKIK